MMALSCSTLALFRKISPLAHQPRPAAETRESLNTAGPKTVRSAGARSSHLMFMGWQQLACKNIKIELDKARNVKLRFSQIPVLSGLGKVISRSFLAVSHSKPPCLCKWLANVCAMGLSFQPLLPTPSEGWQLKIWIQPLVQTWGAGLVYRSQLVSDAVLTDRTPQDPTEPLERLSYKVSLRCIPSGKQTKLWTITIFDGKTHYFDWAIFNSYVSYFSHYRITGG